MKKLKIYLDNCCFNRPFDDQSQLKIHIETQAKLFVQKEVLNNTFVLAWSYILDYENNQNPYIFKKQTIGQWKNIAAECITATPAIINQAANFTSAGLKNYDALHMACAIAANCDYFLTTDLKLLKFHTEKIKILNPVVFLTELEVNRNED